MESMFLPFLLVIVASFFQGSFGLGMKYMSPLKWESWWLVHATVAMIAFPLIWALIVIPDLFGLLSTAFNDELIVNAVYLAMFFGFLWGIGGIMFGVSIPYIGLSLTYGLVMGLASSVGSIIPLLQMDNATENSAFPYVISGVVVMLIGVAITAYAGIQRDKLKAAEDRPEGGIVKGIVIASACGILSAFLNIGFANAAPVQNLAEASGALTRNSSLAAWVVVLIGAYIMNAGYAIFLLFKNKTWGSFNVKGGNKAYMWAIIAGLCWFAALGISGQGAALLGEIGPVLTWPIMLGLSLVVGNIWAYRSGEWKGAKKPFTLLLSGLAVLIFATFILGYSQFV